MKTATVSCGSPTAGPVLAHGAAARDCRGLILGARVHGQAPRRRRVSGGTDTLQNRFATAASDGRDRQISVTAHTHHPSDALIAGFATGGLPLGPSLAVRLHVEICPACQSSVQEIEAAQGQRLLVQPDAPMRPDALQRALDAIDVGFEPTAAGSEGASPPPGLRLPASLTDIGLAAPVHLTPDAWVAHLAAPRVGGWRTYLFCAPAGTALPTHGHLGDELIMVLEGGFDDGRTFVSGDFVENTTGFVHTMQVWPNSRMVALISSGDAIAWRPADRDIGARLDI